MPTELIIDAAIPILDKLEEVSKGLNQSAEDFKEMTDTFKKEGSGAEKAVNGLVKALEEEREETKKLARAVQEARFEIVKMAKAQMLNKDATEDVSEAQEENSKSTNKSSKSFLKWIGAAALVAGAARAIGALLKASTREYLLSGQASTIAVDSQNQLDQSTSRLRINLGRLIVEGLAPMNVAVAEFVDGIADYLSQPVSDKLKEEQVGLNVLTNELLDANTEEERRADIFELLNEKYPAILEGQQLESLNLQDIANNLRDANSEFEKKIALQLLDETQQERLQDITTNTNKVRKQEFELRARLLDIADQQGKQDQTAGKSLQELIELTNSAQAQVTPGFDQSLDIEEYLQSITDNRDKLATESDELLAVRNELIENLFGGVAPQEDQIADSLNVLNAKLAAEQAIFDAATTEEQRKASNDKIEIIKAEIAAIQGLYKGADKRFLTEQERTRRANEKALADELRIRNEFNAAIADLISDADQSEIGLLEGEAKIKAIEEQSKAEIDTLQRTLETKATAIIDDETELAATLIQIEQATDELRVQAATKAATDRQKIREDIAKENVSFTLQELEDTKAIEELILEESRNTFATTEAFEEFKKNRLLEIQREYLQGRLDILLADENASASQIANLQKQIEVINNEVKSLTEGDTFSGFDGFLSKLFNVDDQGELNQIKSSLTQLSGEIANSVNSVFDAQIAAQQRYIADRDQNISRIEQQLNDELKLEQEGYANSADGLQDRLDKEKALREQAVIQQRKLQKQQIELDAAIQASSLITTIANVLSSSSKLPPIVSVITATATIASLFALFKRTKAAVSQLEYGGTGEGKQLLSKGKGTIKGRSHSQGGTVIEAERGEPWAVIPKNSPYKDVFHGVTDMILNNTMPFKNMKDMKSAIANGSTHGSLPVMERLTFMTSPTGDLKGVRETSKRVSDSKDLMGILNKQNRLIVDQSMEIKETNTRVDKLRTELAAMPQSWETSEGKFTKVNGKTYTHKL